MAKRDVPRRIDLRPKKPYTQTQAEYPQYSLDELTDVTCPEPADRESLIYDADQREWVNRKIGAHQVHFNMPLGQDLTAPPGPCNITGVNFVVTAVRITANGAVSGSLTIDSSYAFTLPAGGGYVHYGSLNDTWNTETTIQLTINTDGGDGTYLSLDIAVE